MTLDEMRRLAEEGAAIAEKTGPLFVIEHNGKEFLVPERDRKKVEEFDPNDFEIEDYVIAADELLDVAHVASIYVPSLCAAVRELAADVDLLEGASVALSNKCADLTAERDAALARMKELETDIIAERISLLDSREE